MGYQRTGVVEVKPYADVVVVVNPIIHDVSVDTVEQLAAA